MALWSGRFEQGVEAFTQSFGASLSEEIEMYAHDIAGSIAHAHMLARQGIISEEDARAIEAGLLEIKSEIDDGSFEFDLNDEDIHMAIEGELTRRIGDAGKRLHTGRSRNDQVATDIRLYIKDQIFALMKENVELRQTLLDVVSQHTETVLPGYTHLQHAQPVSFAHHMLAYVWMLTRDFTRLKSALYAADMNPLGSAALAGTTYPLNREQTTSELGFRKAIPNSLDAVSDRDYLLDLEYACSVSMMHLSRLSEEIIQWSSQEFNFITLSDAFSTGSSIMPQKKNPDFAELVRGKTGRVYGALMGLLATMKGLPLAYNKDLQESKIGAFDAAKTLHDSMIIMRGMVATMTINAYNMEAATRQGFMAATDIADYLAKKGMPFREAHEVVGNLVLTCERAGKGLEDLTLQELRQASELFESDIVDNLDNKAIMSARKTYGGTAPETVRVQIDEAKGALEKDEAQIANHKFSC
ncbi:MAG: argininosuccinate lyase [Eggerthellaceae bacterium]|nr:argininosuccinate lyase [Eggerthellaceae bacterium]